MAPEIINPPQPNNNPTGGDESVDDIIKFFGADDDPDAPNEEVVSDLIAGNDPETIAKGKNKKDEPKDEEEVPEFEVTSEEDTKINEEEPVLNLPRRQEILKEFPELFKKFPQIEHAMYREKEYAAIFPTIKDAKEAVEVVQEFEKFEEKLLSGDLTDVLKSVQEQNKEAFVVMVDNFLPTLAQVNKEGYHYIIGSVLEQAIASVFTEGNKRGDTQEAKNMKIAAQIFNQFIFGNSDIKQPQVLGSKKLPKNEETDSIASEREELVRERFTSAQENLNNHTSKLIDSAVARMIDPRQSMNDFTRNNAIKNVVSKVESLIEQDSRFQSGMEKLWEKAFADNFSSASIKVIQTAYLEKVKTIIRPIVDSVRSEALKGNRSRPSNKEDKEPPLKFTAPKR
jgi:hypothetical protein